jgi:hypothetical protein
MKSNIIAYKFIIVILLFTGCVSCETDVTQDITLKDTPPRLVVEGGLERNSRFPNQSQRIRLRTTANFLSEEELPLVENARVSVIEGNTTYLFTYSGDGYYVSAGLTPELNKTYTLRIEWNEEVYEAEDHLNEAPPFDNFYFIFKDETLVTDAGYFLQIDTTDPPNIPNYYYYRVFKNGEYIIVPDPGNAEVLVVSDEFFDGQQRIGVNPNDEISFEPGDTGRAQQLGISEAYHDFLFLLFEQTGRQGIPLVGNPPPASIRGNIRNLTNPVNRALGFFYTADVEEDEITITEIE